jgi:hypothetical protein
MITLTPVTVGTSRGFSAFLIDCFNHCYAINDFKSEIDTLEEFWNLIQEPEVYIVNKNNKIVGFFVQDIDHHSKAVGATIFIHPRSCPLSIVSCLKIATLRGLQYIVDNNYEYIEFDTWAMFIANEVKKLVPNLKIHTIRKEWLICHAPASSLNKDTLDLYGITDINNIKITH